MQQDSRVVVINQQPQSRVVSNRIVYNNNSCLNCNACVCHNPGGRVILGIITLMYLVFTIFGFALELEMLGFIMFFFFIACVLICIWNYYRWYLLKKTEQSVMQNVTYNQPMTYPTHPQQYPQSYPPQQYSAQSYPGQPPNYPGQAPHNYPSYPPYPSTYVPQGHPPQSTANAAEAGQGAEAPPPSYEDATKK